MMPQVDFSVLGDLGKTYTDAQNQRMLADLGKGLADGTLDYKQAAGKAAEAGRLDVGLSLLKLGREQEASDKFGQQIAGLFSGQPTETPTMNGPTLANLSARPQALPTSQGLETGPRSPSFPPLTVQPKPVQQATEGIISAVPESGPNAGIDIAPTLPGQRIAQAPDPRLPQQSSPPAAPPPMPATAQNPVTRSIPTLLSAVSNPGLPEPQRKAAEKLLEHALKTSDLPEAQKNYVLYRSQGGTLPFFDYEKQLKTAGATMINTAEGMDAAQAKARIKIDENAIGDLAKKAAAGRSAIPLLNKVMELADKVPGGWAGQASPTIARALSGLGIEVPEGLSNAELLSSISRQFIPTVRDPGSTSNYEQQIYSQAVPGLAQSQEGRIKIARMFKAQIERNNEVVKIYRQYIGSPELDKKLAELENKPMFAADDLRSAEAVASSAAGPSREEIEKEIRRRGLNKR